MSSVVMTGVQCRDDRCPAPLTVLTGITSVRLDNPGHFGQVPFVRKTRTLKKSLKGIQLGAVSEIMRHSAAFGKQFSRFKAVSYQSYFHRLISVSVSLSLSLCLSVSVCLSACL